MNAIILAGGRGSRLEPWHAPKCLMPINGVPILLRLLNHLSAYTVVICTGYRADDIVNAVNGWGLDGQAVRLLNTDENTSMGGRILWAHKQTDSERVLILYGDELADVDIPALLEHHEIDKNAITFAAAYQKITGGMVFKDARPVKIVDGQRILVNIGFVVVEPQCWELLKAEDGLSDWINRVSGHGLPVGVFHHEGKRATVNSLADLKYAEEIWK